MSAPCPFDYTVIRVVPRVDRGEHMNVGVLLFCFVRGFLEARVEIDPRRLEALWPGLDQELVRRHVDAVVRIAAGEADAGPIARLPQRERWHWLVAPRSTMVQTAPVHSGVTSDPEATLAHLVARLVRV